MAKEKKAAKTVEEKKAERAAALEKRQAEGQAAPLTAEEKAKARTNSAKARAKAKGADEAILGADGPAKKAPKFKKGLPTPVDIKVTVAGTAGVSGEEAIKNRDLIIAQIKARRSKKAKAGK